MVALDETPGCPVCEAPVTPSAGGNGRPKIYCSRRCKDTARNRRYQGPPGDGSGKRRPLPDFSVRAGWALRKDVERIERIAADDRFSANRQQVTAHLRSHLEYAAEVCQDLLSRLGNPTEG